MESIVISQPKFSVEIFWAFSTSRFIKDRQVQPAVASDAFIWQMHYPDPSKPSFHFEVSRDELEFRASAKDMINLLQKKWDEFESLAKSVYA